MKINISSILDTGIERENNEDSLIFCPDLSRPEWSQGDMGAYFPLGKLGAIAVVADGMGGANAGEIASEIAINTIKDTFDPNSPIDIENDVEIIEFLHCVVKKADKNIIDRINSDPDTSGMGTTLVLCWILNGKVYIAWCGDSRCYVYNPANGLTPLTTDHSLVQELIDRGEISKEEAFTHPDSNIITRGLGDFDTEAVADIVVHDIHPNDTLLLCSDGLCGYCQDTDIETILANNYTEVNQCCQQLLQLALNAGGYDNISIIAASLINDDQQKPANLTLGQRIKHFFGLA